MGMLNNWDVGGGVSDFWDYIRQPRPHRWTSWGVAVVLALVVFWGFGKYLIPYEKPKPQIIYFENWKADRSEAEVRADWIARAKETTRENARRRAERPEESRVGRECVSTCRSRVSRRHQT